MFMHLPDDYTLKSMNVEGFEIKKLGRLNSLNRIKLISHWKKENGCLVTAFTKILNNENWNFENHPNPIAIAMVRKNINEKG